MSASSHGLAPIEALERAARRHATPCGSGELVWREWGEGTPVILHHGGFGSWLHWVRNVGALAQRHRVMALDLPGLGDSAMPAEPVSVDTIAAPVVQGLERILGSNGACHLIGFSFGGLIAGQVAARLGPRALSLTLVGASGLGLRRRRIELIRRTPDMDPAALRSAQAQNLSALMLHDSSSVDALALAVQAHNDARARIKSRRMSLGRALRDALPALRGRLHAIWGEHDVTATPWLDERRELLASLRPDVDFRVVPGAGHWVQYEAADTFNALALEMLAA